MSVLVSRPSSTKRPVSMRPQAEALTNSDSDWPIWRSQCLPPILSAMSLSAVSSSGMRSSASARHISTTPSSEESEYSCMKASMPPCAGALPSPRRRAGGPVRAPARARSGESRASLRELAHPRRFIGEEHAAVSLRGSGNAGTACRKMTGHTPAVLIVQQSRQMPERRRPQQRTKHGSRAEGVADDRGAAAGDGNVAQRRTDLRGRPHHGGAA